MADSNGAVNSGRARTTKAAVAAVKAKAAAKKGAGSNRVLAQAFAKDVDVKTLQPHPRNPRKGNVVVIGESLEANGFYGAIVAQKSTRRIIAGHHRWLAAKQAGIAKVPVIWVDVDDAAAERIMLADNRTSDLASYDEPLLAAILKEFSATDLSFAGTGYTEFDYASLLKTVEGPEPPTEFVQFGANVGTKNKCPRCGFDF